MNRREFDGRPFIAGSLTGIRAFRVNSDGLLAGVIHNTLWRPGVNEAVCLMGPMARVMWQIQSALAEGLGLPPQAHRKQEAYEHHVAGLKCQCGFYAYFKGKNTYMGHGQVAGLVEGYGVCTVGTRGFRAEKARLVALVRPRRQRFPRLRGWWAAYLRRVHAIVRPPLHKIPHGLAWLCYRVDKHDGRNGARAFKVARWANMRCEQIANGVQLALGLTVALGGIWALDGWPGHIVWAAGMSVMFAVPKPPRKNAAPPLTAAEFERVRSNYPGVPVYRSRRAAVRAHPLTPPERNAS